MIIIALAILFLLPILSILYVKKDKLPQGVSTIVVLSASKESITIDRLNHSIKLLNKYPQSRIIVCGKHFSTFMKNYLNNKKIRNFVIQNKSTNTREDAEFLVRFVTGKFILVTSSAHQRRAYHTFRRVFKQNFYNSPTNDFYTWYSPLLPTGTVATIMNIYKDIKYNRCLF